MSVPMDREKKLAVEQKILLFKWAGEDPLKARELSLIDGMHKYADTDLCEHYKNTSLTLEVLLRRYIIDK